MTRYDYKLVDVFTNQMFGGNQLAVFTNGRGLTTNQMQKIAKELNLAETTFVLPPQASANDYHLRIFTPATEMPMAGHPTVGTAYVLSQSSAVTDGTFTLRFEEQIGVILVEVEMAGGKPGMITMQQPLPEFTAEFSNRSLMADMLSIDTAAIDPNYPIQVVSTGVPFLFVPIRSLAEIKQAKLRLDLWERELAEFATQELYLFTQETEDAKHTVHSRMFAPRFGIHEDPATGAACGPLGSYLVRHGIVTAANQANIISEQGYEIGRPSLIHIGITQENGEISRVTVGGNCAPVGGGYMELGR